MDLARTYVLLLRCPLPAQAFLLSLRPTWLTRFIGLQVFTYKGATLATDHNKQHYPSHLFSTFGRYISLRDQLDSEVSKPQNDPSFQHSALAGSMPWNHLVADDNAITLSMMSDAQARDFFNAIRRRQCTTQLAYSSNDEEVPVRPSILALLGKNIELVAALGFALSNQLPFISWLADVAPPSPALHTLSLHLVRLEEPGVTRATVPLEVPALIAFFEKAPNIGHLALEGLRAPWKAALCRNLTTLQLSDCLTCADISHGDIFDLLRGSLPSLSSLEISVDRGTAWTLAQDQQDIHGDDGNEVHFQSLRELHLSLPQPFLLHILQGIRIPKDLQTLGIDIVDSDPLSWRDNHIIASQIFSSDLLPRTILEGARNVELEVNKVLDSITFTGRRPENELEFRVYVSWKKRYGIVGGEILEGIVKRHLASLSTVESFKILALKPDVPPNNIHRFAARLNSLVHLEIIAHTRLHTPFLAALNNHPHFSFPRLRTMKITTSDLHPLPQLCEFFLPKTPDLKHLYLAFDITMCDSPRDWETIAAGLRPKAMKLIRMFENVDIKIDAQGARNPSFVPSTVDGA